MVVKKKYFKRKARQRKSLKLILSGGLFFCLLVIVGYFIFFTRLFWIKQVEVSSDNIVFKEEIENIVNTDLEQKFLNLVSKRNVLLFSKKETLQRIMEVSPQIREAVIVKRMPNLFSLFKEEIGLKIDVFERESVGIWCQASYQEQAQEILPEDAEGVLKDSTEATSTEGVKAEPAELIRKTGDCFNIDNQGIVFKKTLLVRGKSILNIYSQQPASLGQRVASPQVMNFILGVKDNLGKVRTINAGSLAIDEFEIISDQDVRAKMDAGWQIYFSPVFSVESQLNNLSIVINEEIKEKINNLEYIDLRIDGRVYYLEK